MGKVMRYQSGKVAVYSDANPASPSTAPLTNPLGNLGVIDFHSDLFYPKIVNTFSGSGTIPAVTAGLQVLSTTHATHAHGLGAAPLTLGKVSVTLSNEPHRTTLGTGDPVTSSYVLPFNGTLMMSDYERPANGPYPSQRLTFCPSFMTIESDGTNVYLKSLRYSSYFTSRASISFSYTIYVLDLLETQTTAPTGEAGTPGMELSPTRITMGQRKFDTNSDHIRTASSGTDYLVSGASLTFTSGPVAANASTDKDVAVGTFWVRCKFGDYDAYGAAAIGNTLPSAPSPSLSQIQFP